MEDEIDGWWLVKIECAESAINALATVRSKYFPSKLSRIVLMVMVLILLVL